MIDELEISETKNLIKNGRHKLAVERGATGAARGKVLKNQILAAQAEAARILEEAEEFAAEIRREAREDAETLRAEAYSEGVERAIAEFERHLIDVREIRERVWRETEQDVLRLAVRLTEKILGREIKTDKKAVADVVSTALQNARQQEKLTVRVNPSDLPTVEKEIENLTRSGRTRFIDFVADPRVTAGGCLIESEVGTIDARLETQLRVLERALLSQSEGGEKFD
jgi:type III secretion protein L